jgi:hydrogenase maturation protease
MWTSDGAEGRRSRGEEEQRRGGAEHLFTCSPAHLLTSSLLHTLVLGLGNPILGDDGVGWRVVQQAEGTWLACHSEPRRGEESHSTPNSSSAGVEFDCFSLGGLALMERLVGYNRAILVDAIQSRGGVPGAIYRLTLDDLPTMHANSAHDASLNAALALGRQLGATLPEHIVIYAIEAVNLYDFGETLSPPVAVSVRRAAEMVLVELTHIADSR